MNYFTPDRFARLQDVHDEAAIQDWEQAVREYASTLTNILPQLPAPFGQLLQECPLHDADVLGMTRIKDSLSFTLRPEVADGLLILTYTLVEGPIVNRAALPPKHCTEPVTWLYDELGIELVPGPPSWLTEADQARGDGQATVGTHGILLSNGWEVRLRFRTFHYSRPETFLPSPHAADDGKALLTRSA